MQPGQHFHRKRLVRSRVRLGVGAPVATLDGRVRIVTYARVLADS